MPATVKVPVPALAVTVPETGCVTALPSILSAPAVVNDKAFIVAVVYVGAAVVTEPPI